MAYVILGFVVLFCLSFIEYPLPLGCLLYLVGNVCILESDLNRLKSRFSVVPYLPARACYITVFYYVTSLSKFF